MSELFKKLKSGLEEMDSYLAGDLKNVRVSTRELAVAPLKEISSNKIRKLRISLGLSQEQFAQVLGIKKITVSKWEQGFNSPSGASLRLLEIIAKDPDVLEQTKIMKVAAG